MLLEILQNSQEDTYARAYFLTKTLAQVFSCAFCEISKNTFSYRAPPVAASENTYVIETGLSDFHKMIVAVM